MAGGSLLALLNPLILRWMIDGCLDWQKNGLVRPPVVTASTADYFSEQDTLAQWIEGTPGVVGWLAGPSPHSLGRRGAGLAPFSA